MRFLEFKTPQDITTNKKPHMILMVQAILIRKIKNTNTKTLSWKNHNIHSLFHSKFKTDLSWYATQI